MNHQIKPLTQQKSPPDQGPPKQTADPCSIPAQSDLPMAGLHQVVDDPRPERIEDARRDDHHENQLLYIRRASFLGGETPAEKKCLSK